MDNKIIIGIVAAAVVLCGVWYFSSNSPAGNGGWFSAATTVLPTSPATQQTTTKASPAKTAGSVAVQKPKIAGVNSLSYLFSLKQSLVCSVTTSSYVKRSGTMYISGDKMRVNFTSTSMIADGTYLYVWKNGAPTGLKLLAALSASGSAIASNGGFDPATPLSFACNSWAGDGSLFLSPSSVSFSNTP